MARFLLDRGATVNVADGAGYTPLHGAALAVATITTAGTGPFRLRKRQGGEDGRTGWRHEVRRRLRTRRLDEALAMVKRLLDARSGSEPADALSHVRTGGRCADQSCAAGIVRLSTSRRIPTAWTLVKMLADKGANPNLLRKDGHTPFSVAVLSMDVPIVKEMVARGADLTARYNPTDHFADPVKPISLTRQNQTIMHIAAGAGAAEVIEYLYSLGVRLDAKNSMGETPLDLADHQERYREARAREAAEDKPDRVVVRDTATTDTIKKLLA